MAKDAIVVKYFGSLAEYAGGREVAVEVDGEVKIRDILKLPPGVDPGELVILVNGLSAKPDDYVKPGDRVAVMPHVSGGLGIEPLYQAPLVSPLTS